VEKKEAQSRKDPPLKKEWPMGLIGLFQQCTVFEQDIPFGDGFGDARGHENGSTAEDKNLIGVKDRVAVFIKENQLVAVFLFDLLAKLADAGLLSGLLKSILLVHPGLKGGCKGHGDHGQIDMGAEGGGIVAGRTLNEPCLLGLPKDGVFDLASGIIAVIDFQRFLYRSVGEDNKGVGIGVIDLVRVVHDYDSVDRVGAEVGTVFVTPAAFLLLNISAPLENSRGTLKSKKILET
jgi:hypothetical protein